jgi:hypothetical protein
LIRLGLKPLRGDGKHWRARVPDEVFIERFEAVGPRPLARELDIGLESIAKRRRRLEDKYKREIRSPTPATHDYYAAYGKEEFPWRVNLQVTNGIVIVAGDAHYWPSEKAPVMHRALIHFLNKYREEKTLRAIILNGDVHDFAIISRWPLDWEHRPEVQDEIEVCTERLHEIEMAAGKVPKIWPVGNHDERFSKYCAANADKLKGVKGTQLKDHYPNWKACYEVEINDGPNLTTVKHTFKGGIYAPRNNALLAGCHFVTNHLHSAKIIPVTTKHHTFYGVDTGCLADVWGPQFAYLQGSPRDWRAGMAILTYRDSALLYPELVLGVDKDHVQFRGTVIKV